MPLTDYSAVAVRSLKPQPLGCASSLGHPTATSCAFNYTANNFMSGALGDTADNLAIVHPY